MVIQFNIFCGQPSGCLFLVVKKGREHLAQGKSKEEAVRESMASPKTIDPTIDFRIHRSPKQYNPKEHQFKCSCCGAGFNSQKNNFQKSKRCRDRDNIYDAEYV